MLRMPKPITLLPIESVSASKNADIKIIKTKKSKSKQEDAVPITKGKVEKPKYSKLGQKHKTPLETDSLRIFYTSLLKQNPNSEMALKWCLERGLLSEKKAQAAIVSLGLAKLKI